MYAVYLNKKTGDFTIDPITALGLDWIYIGSAENIEWLKSITVGNWI